MEITFNFISFVVLLITFFIFIIYFFINLRKETYQLPVYGGNVRLNNDSDSSSNFKNFFDICLGKPLKVQNLYESDHYYHFSNGVKNFIIDRKGMIRYNSNQIGKSREDFYRKDDSQKFLKKVLNRDDNQLSISGFPAGDMNEVATLTSVIPNGLMINSFFGKNNEELQNEWNDVLDDGIPIPTENCWKKNDGRRIAAKLLPLKNYSSSSELNIKNNHDGLINLCDCENHLNEVSANGIEVKKCLKPNTCVIHPPSKGGNLDSINQIAFLDVGVTGIDPIVDKLTLIPQGVDGTDTSDSNLISSYQLGTTYSLNDIGQIGLTNICHCKPDGEYYPDDEDVNLLENIINLKKTKGYLFNDISSTSKNQGYKYTCKNFDVVKIE